MGLLDDFSNFVKTPEGIGLLSAAFGGLAGAQRGTPLNNIGRAGMSGVMGYSNAQDQQAQLAQADQMKKIRDTQIEQEARRQAALKSFAGTLPANQAPLMDIAPDAVVASMLKGPEKPPSAVQEYQFAVSQGYKGTFEEFKKSGSGTPFYNFLPTENGYAVGDARTGKIEFPKIGPIMKGTDSPKLQADITRATNQAALDVKVGGETKKAIKTNNQLLSVAKDAEKLLDSNVTHSGFGALLDVAGRGVGVTSESAQNAAKLETLSGWMVANVPRMEGPQSDFDVENYKTMAGKVGNNTIPVAERKAALNTLIGLQEKYKALNQGISETPQKTASIADIAATAKASGRTTAEVTAAMKAKGYIIK